MSKKQKIVAGVVMLVLVVLIAGKYVISKWESNQGIDAVILQAFSEKYNRPANTIAIEVTGETGAFAKGTVNFKEEGGGVWFAIKTAQGWELVFDGNGIVSCEIANRYNFPNTIIPQCFDPTKGDGLVQR